VLTAKVLDPEERRFLDEQVEGVVQKDADALDTVMERVRAAVAAHTREGA
jgi:hypothetical protein